VTRNRQDRDGDKKLMEKFSSVRALKKRVPGQYVALKKKQQRKGERKTEGKKRGKGHRATCGRRKKKKGQRCAKKLWDKRPVKVRSLRA